MGDLPRSLEFSQRSVEMFERTNPEHPSAAMAIVALASVYRERQENAKAKPLFEKAIQILTKNFGPDSPRLVASYNNYGLCLKSLSDFPALMPLSNRRSSLAPKQMARKLPSPRKRSATWAFSTSRRETTRAPVSLTNLLYRSLRKPWGPRMKEQPPYSHSLGLVLRDMGDLRAARPYIERALAIYQKSFGPENPKTIQLVGNLASIYKHEKNYLAARPLVESSLEIVRRTIGPAKQ